MRNAATKFSQKWQLMGRQNQDNNGETGRSCANRVDRITAETRSVAAVSGWCGYSYHNSGRTGRTTSSIHAVESTVQHRASLSIGKDDNLEQHGRIIASPPLLPMSQNILAERKDVSSSKERFDTQEIGWSRAPTSQLLLFL